MSNTYLLITPDDYFSNIRKSLYEDKFAFMESVLKYLERNDIPHMHCYDSIRVYPRDHFEARDICEHLRITDIHYFENGKPLDLLKPKRWAVRSYVTRWTSFDLIASKRMLKGTPRPICNTKVLSHTDQTQTSFHIQKPFIGSFIDFKPRLGLFGPIECAVQGSFLR